MSQATQNFVAKCKTFWEEADKDGNGLSIQELASMIREKCNVQMKDADIAVSPASCIFSPVFRFMRK